MAIRFIAVGNDYWTVGVSFSGFFFVKIVFILISFAVGPFLVTSFLENG